jgi:hypothetical protein
MTFADRKGGFPHSEIFGSKGARASPKLIAACHVLHRLSTPRHPSEALMRLIVLSKAHVTGPYESPAHALCICQTIDVFSGPSSKRLRAGGTLPFTMRFLHAELSSGMKTLSFTIAADSSKSGGARRDRTDDLMLAKHALYQLSYGPIRPSSDVSCHRLGRPG